MKKSSIFRKTLLCSIIGAIGAPQFSVAAPLDLSTLPPGVVAIPPTPNVLLTVDDSGSMDDPIDGSGTPKKINELKKALKEVFEDKLLLPDGKIRLAWQAMFKTGANTIASGSTNSMKLLTDTHRTNFLNFSNTLTAPGGSTPSHTMMKQAYNYMKTPKGINSPWAFNPGVKEEPYLGCRRSYHIFMTDGAWNGSRSTDAELGEVDNKTATLPDTPAVTYDISSNQTRIYRDSEKNTLADWAMRMWREDLQPDIDNDIKPSTTDGVPSTETFGGTTLNRYWNPKHNPARWQHLVHYTIGYGKPAYEWTGNPKWSVLDDDNYGAGGDFSKLVNGTMNWPTGLSNNNTKNPAELWHMAINSRGKFYPTGPGRKYDLKEAFRKILENINLENSADVASMTANSTTNIRTDVNKFVAGFDPKKWSGYVYASSINTLGAESPELGWGINTGQPAPQDRQTTAQKLDALTDINNRFIITTNDNTNKGVSFEWETGTSKLSSSQKTLLDVDGKGQDRVNFLRGNREKEGGTVLLPFRVRDSRQGDIVNSNVWYVGSPTSNYPYKGYRTFTSTHRNRLPMIYVGGNDGMLHGFSAVNGDEKIAYIPKALYPELSKLSDPSYSHRYYVDGSPFTGDVDIADRSDPGYVPDWRTMLVGSLGAGGKGYFILDVTQPGSKDATVPSTFTKSNAASLVVADRTIHPAAPLVVGSDDEDIGHIFAAPVTDVSNPYKATQIALLNDNRWAVVMGNGYNSKKERPVLLIQYLDGAKELKKIVATGTQAVSVPENSVTDTNVLANGLSAPRIVDINGDGKTDVIYAGDIKGNLWKFDLTSKTSSDWGVAEFGSTKKPLFVATYTDGKRQPISIPPIVKANDRGVGGMMVAFATGVNVTDAHRNSPDVQTVYSVHDNTKYKLQSGGVVVNTDASDDGVAPKAVTGRANLIKQDMVSTTPLSQSAVYPFYQLTDNKVDYLDADGKMTSTQGWYFDFQFTSQRVLDPMEFFDASNNLMVYSTTPAYGGNGTGTESCEPSGTPEKRYLTLLNIMDGRRPSVQVMDTNNDGVYDKVADGNATMVLLEPGTSSSTRGRKTQTITSSKGKKLELALLPEQPLRPTWRQLR
jgi:type IV pilus assembly protein PilY1